MQTPNTHQFSFLALVALVSAAFIWLLLPFYGALLWAAILATLFHPLQRRLVRQLDGRRTLAAALSVWACVCIVLIPGSILLSSLVVEAADFYDRLDTRQGNLSGIVAQTYAALPSPATNLLVSLDLNDPAEIEARLRAVLSQSSQFIATQLLSIGQGTARFLVDVGVMLYVLFFLFRDGTRLTRLMRDAGPLSTRHMDRFMSKFSQVAQATVRGNFIIGLIQGVIGGLTFWLLGVEAALLWGAVMGVLSLLPAIGSFLIWGPVGLYMLMTGDYVKGAILLAVGTLIISMVDNLLRPALVGKELQLPDYVVLVSTLGGLTLFGINGFVIGPLIAALFVTVWAHLAEEKQVQP